MSVIPPDGIDPGIYFDMDEEAYHAHPALGSTDIKRLLTGPSEFHWHWSGNPEPEEEEDADHFTFGKAVHKHVLEGAQAFSARYASKPEGDNVLVTADDMRAWLRARGLLEKGTKEAMADRILALDPGVVIQDRMLERLKADGKHILSADAYRRIVMASAYITKNANLARSFEGGHREVSVFWIRRGIRMKAHFDYLRVIKWEERRCAVISDLKSFSRAKPGQPIEQAIHEAAAGYKHQAAHYFDGLYHAKRHIKEGLVHGSTEDDWLQRVATSQTALFAFVFFKSQGAPFSQAVVLQPKNPLIETYARPDIERALDTFQLYYDTFGAEGPWITLDQPRELSVDELPRWLL
jgi:hypothetical protein